jgi:hypothetical protein
MPADGWMCKFSLEQGLEADVRQGQTSATPWRASDRGILPMSMDEYLELLDWSGRTVRAGKVWYEDYVLQISPRTGNVLGLIDLASLYPQRERPRENVLNGTAYDSTRQRIFVTGKNWPHLFEIKLVSE